MVIVGAGIMGVSTAYHLARRRVGRVVVLERDGVCSGSTALASGGIRHQYANRIGIELTLQSIETFERFETEFGVDPHFRQHGYLILATTERRAGPGGKERGAPAEPGVDVELLSPEETRQSIPLPPHRRPPGRDLLSRAMAMRTPISSRPRWLRGRVIWVWRSARAAKCMGIRRNASRVEGVTTSEGSLDAPVVVLAAGAWTGVVGRLAGVDIPVPPRRRSKFITAAVSLRAGFPAATPFVIDTHQGISLRREGAGLLLGIGRKHDAPSFGTEVDWSLTDPLIERIVRRVPALADAGLMRGWAGLYEMTPDQTGIVSAVPDVPGLHVIAGWSGHGFMHGPIAGQLMAELIADGRATHRRRRAARARPVRAGRDHRRAADLHVRRVSRVTSTCRR